MMFLITTMNGNLVATAETKEKAQEFLRTMMSASRIIEQK